MKLHPSDTSIPKLPDSYVIQPAVELAQTDVFAPRVGLNDVRPLVDLLSAKDEAWLVHVANALKFHALDHTNYARWLPVHVRDMVQLAQQNPEVHAEFMKGNLVVQNSRRKFILMAKDQAHEYSNKILQTKGGAAGLYENHEALMLFMLAGPDCARMVEEFEAIHDPSPSSTEHSF